MAAPLRWRIVGLLVVTTLALALVLHGLDLSATWAALASYEWERVPVALSLYGAALLARAARLRRLLSRPVAYGRVLLISGASHLASAVMPLHLGTLVAPYLLDTTSEVPFGEGVAAAVMERVLDLLVLALLVGVAATWIELPGELEVLGLVIATRLAIAIALCAALAGLAGLALAGPAGVAAVVRTTRRIAPELEPVVVRVLGRFVQGVRGLATRPRAFAIAALWTLGWWSASMAAGAVTMGGFASLPSPTPLAVVLNQIGIVAGGSLVPSPGHVGGFEAGAMGAMMTLGASTDAARAFALVLHATQLGFTVAAGLTCFAVAGWSFGEVVRGARSPA